MDLKEVINRVRQIRDKANLSARELSLRLGKNSTYITKLESGEFKPSMETILEIITCCNSTTEEFFYKTINDYKLDIEVLRFFQHLSSKQKQAILMLYNK